MQKDKDIKTAQRMKNIGRVIMIPMILVASPIVGYFFGYILDYFLKTNPWFKIIFLFLGVAAGIKETIKAIKDFERDVDSK